LVRACLGFTSASAPVDELRIDVPDVAATRALAGRVAQVLRPGDLVLLTGDLGAGKTTFTQALGAALGVAGRISSPTFIIAREHPGQASADGTISPALIHVDAYRLGSLDELDALDLDASLEDAITVVEWGKGLVEGLTEDRLEIELIRARGATSNHDVEPGNEARRITIKGIGPRWDGVQIKSR